MRRRMRNGLLRSGVTLSALSSIVSTSLMALAGARGDYLNAKAVLCILVLAPIPSLVSFALSAMWCVLLYRLRNARTVGCASAFQEPAAADSLAPGRVAPPFLFLFQDRQVARYLECCAS